jgi:hypothetical protein
MIDIVKDVYLFLFFLSLSVIVRNTFFLIRSVRMNERFKINNVSLITLGISISFFITSIISFLR